MRRHENWREILRHMSKQQTPFTAVEIRDAVCAEKGLASDVMTSIRQSGVKLIPVGNVRNDGGVRGRHASLYRIEFPL